MSVIEFIQNNYTNERMSSQLLTHDVKQHKKLPEDVPVQPLSGWFKRLREGKSKSGHRRWYQIRGRVLSSYKEQVDVMQLPVLQLSTC